MKILLKALLFAAGIILGLLLFFPRHVFWTQLLTYAEKSRAEVSGRVTDSASWTQALLRDVHITILGHSFYFPELKISLGLSPLVRAELSNTETLLLNIYPSGKITAGGGIDLSSTLSSKALSGTIDTDTFLIFDNFSSPPRQGELSLGADGLQWPDMPGKLESLDISAKLRENILQIDLLQGTGDMDFQCRGRVEVNWDRPSASAYQVSGTWTLNSTTRDFEQTGILNDLI